MRFLNNCSMPSPPFIGSAMLKIAGVMAVLLVMAASTHATEFTLTASGTVVASEPVKLPVPGPAAPLLEDAPMPTEIAAPAATHTEYRTVCNGGVCTIVAVEVADTVPQPMPGGPVAAVSRPTSCPCTAASSCGCSGGCSGGSFSGGSAPLMGRPLSGFHPFHRLAGLFRR